eukprot:8549588-Ditylum_brightwellii.AAC.1
MVNFKVFNFDPKNESLKEIQEQEVIIIDPKIKESNITTDNDNVNIKTEPKDCNIDNTVESGYCKKIF